MINTKSCILELKCFWLLHKYLIEIYCVSLLILWPSRLIQFWHTKTFFLCFSLTYKTKKLEKKKKMDELSICRNKTPVNCKWYLRSFRNQIKVDYWWKLFKISFVCPELTWAQFDIQMSQLMRFWYFSSSVNSFFKRACAAIQMLDFWSHQLSTSILHVYEQRRLWRDCAGSPEPSLVAYVISAIISWASSNFPVLDLFIFNR